MNLRPSSGGEGGGPGNRPPSGAPPPTGGPSGDSLLGLLSGMKIHLPQGRLLGGWGRVATNLRPSSGGGPGNRLPSALPPPTTTTTRGGPSGDTACGFFWDADAFPAGLFQGLSFAGAMAVP